MSFISAVVVQKESKLKAARMHIYVRRGAPNYQTGLAKMRTVGADLGVPIEVLVPLPLPLSF
jgi:ATP citrate (pro-S)-lyase